MKELDIVCGIIPKNNTYLIGKRKSKIHNNIWEFPGGKVESKETKEEAIIRELKEELGIDCEVEKYLCSIEDARSDILLHVHAYICIWKKGELEIRNHHEIRFVDVLDLYAYNFEECDHGIIDALVEYDKNKIKKF